MLWARERRGVCTRTRLGNQAERNACEAPNCAFHLVSESSSTMCVCVCVRDKQTNTNKYKKEQTAHQRMTAAGMFTGASTLQTPWVEFWLQRYPSYANNSLQCRWYVHNLVECQSLPHMELFPLHHHCQPHTGSP